MLMAVHKWAPVHLSFATAHLPGEFSLIYKDMCATGSSLGNLSNFFLSLMEFWGVCTFQPNVSHLELCTTEFFTSGVFSSFSTFWASQGSASFCLFHIYMLSVSCYAGFRSPMKSGKLFLPCLPPFYSRTDFPRLESWRIDPWNLT